MARILFIYSTVDGHTREICARLGAVVERGGHAATLAELGTDEQPDPGNFACVVIGASIRYGKHRPDVARFIEAHRGTLQSRPSAFFSVNAVARKPDKRTAETNPYVRKFLRQISWRPPVIEIFAGKIDYPKYNFWDRTMIRLIMWMTKGPTDPGATVDFTDWGQVEAFGAQISAMADGR